MDEIPHFARAPRPYLSLDELAQALHVGREWLRRHRRRLEHDFGFPRPAPGMGNHYDPLAVKLWQDRNLPPELVDRFIALLPGAPHNLTARGDLAPDGEEALALLLDGRARALAEETGK